MHFFSFFNESNRDDRLYNLYTRVYIHILRIYCYNIIIIIIINNVHGLLFFNNAYSNARVRLVFFSFFFSVYIIILFVCRFFFFFFYSLEALFCTGETRNEFVPACVGRGIGRSWSRCYREERRR